MKYYFSVFAASIRNTHKNMYYKRIIDTHLQEWATSTDRMPILLRGALQIGKSTAVRHLSEQFEHYVEVNFEFKPDFIGLFEKDLDVKRIIEEIEIMVNTPIEAGKTLLFLDEIQECPQAIKALRYFREITPDLHVIAAGSLLEFVIENLSGFGVGRIQSLFMYPMSFDEFLEANGENFLIKARNKNTSGEPLSATAHDKLVYLMRRYMLVGGMPKAVAKWVETGKYLECQKIHDGIIQSYEDDFSKYQSKADPILLQLTMRSIAIQNGNKFIYQRVGEAYRAAEVKKAIEALILAGVVVPVTHTAANGFPLGCEADVNYRKLLLFDTGITLRILQMNIDETSEITEQIIIASAQDLVNKGAIAEQITGLELIRYRNPNLRQELFYWVRKANGAQSEIDFLTSSNQKIVPIEVKSGIQGGMKSLWLFMREKKLNKGIRVSLENFGKFNHTDTRDNDAIREVRICPLYAISMLPRLLVHKLEISE